MSSELLVLTLIKYKLQFNDCEFVENKNTENKQPNKSQIHKNQNSDKTQFMSKL